MGKPIISMATFHRKLSQITRVQGFLLGPKRGSGQMFLDNEPAQPGVGRGIQSTSSIAQPTWLLKIIVDVPNLTVDHSSSFFV